MRTTRMERNKGKETDSGVGKRRVADRDECKGQIDGRGAEGI